MTCLGLGTYALAWAIGMPQKLHPTPMNIFSFLDAAASVGVKLVQIADNLPLHHLSPADIANVKRKAESLNINIEVGTRGIGAEHLQTYLRLAQALESPILRILTDTTNHHPTQQEIIATLKSVLPSFEKAHVTLAIENHDRLKTRTLAEIIHQLESPAVGICLDTVNSFGALEGPDVVIDTLGRYVVSLHIKDFVIQRPDHLMGFVIQGAPAGKGMLNIPRILETLQQQGREFNAILELWPPFENTIEATVTAEFEWVVTSIKYLRQFIKE